MVDIHEAVRQSVELKRQLTEDRRETADGPLGWPGVDRITGV